MKLINFSSYLSFFYFFCKKVKEGICLIFSQLIKFLTLICFICSSSLAFLALADSIDSSPQGHYQFDHTYAYQNDSYEESVPGNYAWFKFLFADDNEGILNEVREQVSQWEGLKNYNEAWSLESTGLYETPSDEEKMKYLRKRLMKYVDKRLAGEMKKENTAQSIKKVGEVQEMLRADSKIEITEEFKLRFRARLLQGKATLLINNPYFDWSNHFKSNGEIHISLGKDIDQLGMRTGFDYYSKNGIWRASLNKQITDSISSSISSQQKTRSMAFSEESDQKIELNFSQPFNF